MNELTKLGSPTDYRYKRPHRDMLETFTNPHPDIYCPITLTTEEFTSLCPKTGQPDFASIMIRYVPKEKCLETKSLKLYLFAYRQEPAFMEDITGRIMKDLAFVLLPKNLVVTATFNSRGGITLKASAIFGEMKNDEAPDS